MTATVEYLSMDSLSSGVGASQVVPYVVALAEREITVSVTSFEPGARAQWVETRLAAAGVRWRSRPFGRNGSLGGVGRVGRAALALRGADTIHARSDVAGAAALLAAPRRLVWDMRSFWADQRLALGMLRTGSAEERVLRRVERALAARADVIIVLAAAAIPVLVARHGEGVAGRVTVVPTCVDLDRFAARPLPGSGPWRFLLSGTLNNYYDVPRMLELVSASRAAHDTELVVLRPEASSWDSQLIAAGATLTSATPDEVPMHVACAHVGLAICRADAGPSLAAAMPTKIAEFLATGRPVVVNRGLGDLDELLRAYDCGVVLDDSPSGPARAVAQLGRLLSDSNLPARCRALASDHFDVRKAADVLAGIYRAL